MIGIPGLWEDVHVWLEWLRPLGGTASTVALSIGATLIGIWMLSKMLYARQLWRERRAIATDLPTVPDEVIEDMMRLFNTISDKESHPFAHPHMIGPQDHSIQALKEKYASWFPPNQTDADMQDWIEGIIARLETLIYGEADKRIRKAVANKSW